MTVKEFVRKNKKSVSVGLLILILSIFIGSLVYAIYNSKCLCKFHKDFFENSKKDRMSVNMRAVPIQAGDDRVFYSLTRELDSGIYRFVDSMRRVGFIYHTNNPRQSAILWTSFEKVNEKGVRMRLPKPGKTESLHIRELYLMTTMDDAQISRLFNEAIKTSKNN
jgi:hypothetical protein